MLKRYILALCVAVFIATPTLATKADDGFECHFQNEHQNGRFQAIADLNFDGTPSHSFVVWSSNKAGPHSASLSLSWSKFSGKNGGNIESAWISYFEYSRAYRSRVKVEIRGSKSTRPVFYSSSVFRLSKLSYRTLPLDRAALVQFARSESGLTLSVSDKAGTSLFERKIDSDQLENILREAVLVQQKIEKVAAENGDDCHSIAQEREITI